MSEVKSFHYLVVDDDGESRKTIVEYLRSMGYEQITEAADGAEAIRALDRDSSINFILSDWDMPLMNGLGLLQKIKADPVKANIPFVIMTSPISQEAEKVVLAAENLVDGYLIKPFRISVLKDKINEVLQVSIRGPQKQVVVVDDDPDSREMVIDYLKQMGFKDIVGIEDGRSALTHLSINLDAVGLVVSDWEMPEMNGLDLLRACKSNPLLEKIPFLMITSQTSIENMKVMQAAKSKVDDYLLKPFNLAEIRKRIEKLVERERTRGEVEVLIDEGIEHVEHGRYQRASKVFEEVLKLEDDNEIALRQLGELTIRLKSVDASLPYFKRAVESNPTNPQGYLRLSAVYEQLGWIDKAIALLMAANHQISFSAELHFTLGKLYMKKGANDAARGEFEKTLEIQLDHQEARLMIEMLGPGRGK